MCSWLPERVVLLCAPAVAACGPELVFTHTAALRGRFDAVELGADPADLHHSGGGRVLHRRLPDGEVDAVFQPGMDGVRLLAVEERGGATTALVAARDAAFVWGADGAAEPLIDFAGGAGVRAGGAGGGVWALLQAAPACRLWWLRPGAALEVQALPAAACAAEQLAVDAAGERVFIPGEGGLFVADGAGLSVAAEARGVRIAYEPLTGAVVVGSPGSAEVVAWGPDDGERWRVELPFPVVDLTVLGETGLVVALLLTGDGAAIALLDGATGDGLQSLDLPTVPGGVRAGPVGSTVVTWAPDELHAFRVDAAQLVR